MSGKRTDYISWDEYFMGVAALAGMRSKDPHTQVGCCIVSEAHKILSMGYNGLPARLLRRRIPVGTRGRGFSLHTKYPYVTHSELNAILNFRGRNVSRARRCT
jgi:dCMP deaminase